MKNEIKESVYGISMFIIIFGSAFFCLYLDAVIKEANIYFGIVFHFLGTLLWAGMSVLGHFTLKFILKIKD